jgi:Family of unknown function (DUF6445)
VFSENFKVIAAPIAEGVHAFVVDDALADPDALVQFASKAKSAFRDAAPNLFPGAELRMTDAFSAKFEDFFKRYIRKFFDARRTLSFSTRLSMITGQHEQLHPAHWLPQCDLRGLVEGQTMICFELHLFRDEALGGTGFFMPRKSTRDVFSLVGDSQTMNSNEFAAKHGIARGYCVEANPYFQLTRVIDPKFNRLIFYDAAMFRAPCISVSEKLVNDPANARLMLHGNFLCKRHADGRANRWLG